MISSNILPVFTRFPYLPPNCIFCSHLFQEDDDGHLLALQICNDLLIKQKETFLDHFARLGIFHKVLGLAGNSPAMSEMKDNEEDDVTDGESSSAKKVIYSISLPSDQWAVYSVDRQLHLIHCRTIYM